MGTTSGCHRTAILVIRLLCVFEHFRTCLSWGLEFRGLHRRRFQILCAGNFCNLFDILRGLVLLVAIITKFALFLLLLFIGIPVLYVIGLVVVLLFNFLAYKAGQAITD